MASTVRAALCVIPVLLWGIVGCTPDQPPAPQTAPLAAQNDDRDEGDLNLTAEQLAEFAAYTASPEIQALRRAIDECLGRRPADPDDPRCEPAMTNTAGEALAERLCFLTSKPSGFGGTVYLVITARPPHQLLELWGFVYDGAELPVLRGAWPAELDEPMNSEALASFGPMCREHESLQF